MIDSEERLAGTAELLRGAPLFEGMTDRAIEHVASLAREVDYDAGQVVMREGEPGTEFVVIVDGVLQISQGNTPITRLGAGDFLGEISLVDGRPRSATATALEPVRALVIERHAFLDLIDRSSAVRHEVLMALTERIRRDGVTSLG